MALNYEVSTAQNHLHKYIYQRWYNQIYSQYPSGMSITNGKVVISPTDSRYVIIPMGMYLVGGVLIEVIENSIELVTGLGSVNIYMKFDGSADEASIVFTNNTLTNDNLVISPSGVAYTLLGVANTTPTGITEITDSNVKYLKSDWYQELVDTGASNTLEIARLKDGVSVLWRGSANVGTAVTFSYDITGHRGFILGFSGGQGTAFLPNSYRGEDSRTLYGASGTSSIVSNPNVKASLYNTFNGLTYLTGPYPIIYVLGVK